MKELWMRHEDDGWRFYDKPVERGRRILVEVLREVLLKQLEEFEGDVVMIPVALAEGVKRNPPPMVPVPKEKVVQLVRSHGALWNFHLFLDDPVQVGALEPLDPPSDIRIG